MTPKKTTYTSYKSPDSNSEEELIKRLKKHLFLLVVIGAAFIISISFFGPKVGSLFFIFSKHRNDKEQGDIIPPATPIFSQVPEATNKRKLTLNGATEPGASVAIFVNGPEKGTTTADNDGKFTFADIELVDGQNIIFALAKDGTGNESDKSKTYNVTFDDKEPEIKELEPKEGTTVRNLNKRIIVKGSLNETAEVKVNGQNALVKSDNTFEVVIGVESGEVEIKIEAVDKAGNKEEKSFKVRYERSS